MDPTGRQQVPALKISCWAGIHGNFLLQKVFQQQEYFRSKESGSGHSGGVPPDIPLQPEYRAQAGRNRNLLTSQIFSK